MASADEHPATSAHGYRSWHRLTEPVVLFPLLAVVLLAILWAATVNLVAVERAGAREGAQVALKMTDTYEAQVVRALREIDYTLSLLAYMRDRNAPDAASTSWRPGACCRPVCCSS